MSIYYAPINKETGEIKYLIYIMLTCMYYCSKSVLNLLLFPFFAAIPFTLDVMYRFLMPNVTVPGITRSFQEKMDIFSIVEQLLERFAHFKTILIITLFVLSLLILFARLSTYIK